MEQSNEQLHSSSSVGTGSAPTTSATCPTPTRTTTSTVKNWERKQKTRHCERPIDLSLHPAENIVQKGQIASFYEDPMKVSTLNVCESDTSDSDYNVMLAKPFSYLSSPCGTSNIRVPSSQIHQGVVQDIEMQDASVVVGSQSQVGCCPTLYDSNDDDDGVGQQVDTNVDDYVVCVEQRQNVLEPICASEKGIVVPVPKIKPKKKVLRTYFQQNSEIRCQCICSFCTARASRAKYVKHLGRSLMLNNCQCTHATLPGKPLFVTGPLSAGRKRDTSYFLRAPPPTPSSSSLSLPIAGSPTEGTHRMHRCVLVLLVLSLLLSLLLLVVLLLRKLHNRQVTRGPRSVDI